jgi:FO synthase
MLDPGRATRRPAAGEEPIRAAGRLPRQRTTLYGEPPAERVHAPFGALPLEEPVDPPVDTSRLRPAKLIRPGLAVA